MQCASMGGCLVRWGICRRRKSILRVGVDAVSVCAPPAAAPEGREGWKTQRAAEARRSRRAASFTTLPLHQQLPLLVPARPAESRSRSNGHRSIRTFISGRGIVYRQYWFRRGMPTIAITTKPTWARVLVPTCRQDWRLAGVAHRPPYSGRRHWWRRPQTTCLCTPAPSGTLTIHSLPTHDFACSAYLKAWRTRWE